MEDGRMSDELECNADGSAALVLGDYQTAWHHMGTLAGVITLDDAYAAVPQLGARINAEPHYHRIDGQVEVVPDMVSHVREATSVSPATYVGSVGKDRYQLVQPRDAFRLVDDVMGLTTQMAQLADQHPHLAALAQPKVTAAGCLRGGRQAFVMVHLGDDYLIPGDPNERRQRYLGGINSYDGSMSLTLCRTSIRWVCANTVHAGMNEGRKVAVRHVGNVAERMGKARQALGLELAAARVQALSAEYLCDVQVTDAQVEGWLLRMAPATDPITGKAKSGRAATMAAKVRDTIGTIYMQDPTVGDKRGTAYGFLQAVTAYTDHHVDRRETRTGTKADNRFEAVVWDDNKLANYALRLAGEDEYANALAKWTTEATKQAHQLLASIPA
jgi:phage/plasmid-like protein (TIGR03299 family)